MRNIPAPGVCGSAIPNVGAGVAGAGTPNVWKKRIAPGVAGAAGMNPGVEGTGGAQPGKKSSGSGALGAVPTSIGVMKLSSLSGASFLVLSSFSF